MYAENALSQNGPSSLRRKTALDTQEANKLDMYSLLDSK
jgi:hypothetical protein